MVSAFVVQTCLCQTTDDEKYEQASKYYEAKDYDKATPILFELAKKNNSKALLQIGFSNERGYGVKQDMEKCLEYTRKSAEMGEAQAMNNLGWYYQKGMCVDIDLDKAINYYEQASEKGNTQAMVNLGWLYLDNEDYYKDLHPEHSRSYIEKQAEKWFRLAAKQDNPYGIYGLAWYYYTLNLGGIDIWDGIKKSTPLFEKAAKRGSGNSQLFVGSAEMREYKYESALNWFKQAEKNNAGEIDGVSPSVGQIVCKFFIDNPQYKYYWNNDCCVIYNYIYSEDDYYVGATLKDKFGFIKLSKLG